MIVLLKNCSLLNKSSKARKYLFVLACFSIITKLHGQIANYVNNPSFEMALPSVTFTAYDAVKYWGAMDTINNGSLLLYSKTLGTVPYGFGGFQYPKSGNNYIGTDFFCSTASCGPGETRWYPRNRLKQILKSNTTYCAKYHVVNTNNCVVGISNYGIFFGGEWLDTTKYGSIPITYLTPQVEWQGGIIADTLKWIPVTGTFVANGDEKYMVLGNFKSNASTQTLVINPTYLPTEATDVQIDDVSLIEMDLPAYAGRDTFFIPGDSIFIGREPDVGIDEACTWYKLPDMSNAIDTVAGLWIKPATTSTYVVRQQLWCSGVKWDTVVVYQSATGIQEAKTSNQSIEVFPIPAKDQLQLQWNVDGMDKLFIKGEVLNSLGQTIKEADLNYNNRQATVDVKELPAGVYVLKLVAEFDARTVSKRFVISR